MATVYLVRNKVLTPLTCWNTVSSNEILFNKRISSKHISQKLFLSTSSIRRREDEIDGLKRNPYYAKYSKKIDSLNCSSVKEYLKRLSLSGQICSGKDPRSSSQPKSNLNVDKPTLLMSPEKKLENILDVNALRNNTIEKISIMWNEKHKDKNAVISIIPAAIWNTLSSRFLEYNTFLLPLPRNQGYEYMVVQLEGKEAHFTSLYNFQVYGENSPECLNLVHYTELLEEKEVVLMSGEYDKNLMTYEEASCLSVQLLLYYGVTTEPKKLAHLERFTYNTDEFSHFDLIAELENSKNVPLPSMLNS